MTTAELLAAPAGGILCLDEYERTVSTGLLLRLQALAVQQAQDLARAIDDAKTNPKAPRVVAWPAVLPKARKGRVA